MNEFLQLKFKLTDFYLFTFFGWLSTEACWAFSLAYKERILSGGNLGQLKLKLLGDVLAS